MVGFPVTKEILDGKIGYTAIQLREAFEQIQTVAAWLANHSVVNGVDPLVSDYGYTADEAYAIRIYFETFESVRAGNQTTSDIGRKLTGLQ